ncbi:Ribosomal protein L24A [Giardia duodenalis]|uniref:Ribosomal protein L24A n=2 Tax=Giardia intestinalis TaxID=5741 RepID=A8BRH7_GIAIC|nr:Ribosomal protein L24A [Giardia intestinalis]7PWG_W Chain W, Ribosomal protein L24A [Giardia lamblia ATCC 50803]7PWO_W2 Chain W2, Ribosomal protein L24A [Giardia lamblia ATCC 50803]8FRU_W Chain W, 60S ribosomal protein eL24 [Giardia intestinalis assemblage A]ESU36554.1 LSU ribosomal protein L24E [Giardia intestinalis]KAE8306002.1 Ribosomal protein L24A [Giardia intestinalis]|eukprot:XP_001705268.1 Ribosomal protein L24A [Giardia lamblia ATCC 50803]
MVTTNQCSYSGRKILPGYGKRMSRHDKVLLIFLNRKASVHYLNKWNPRKIRWTLASRRARGKEVIVKARERVTRKAVVSKRNFLSIDDSKLEALKSKYSRVN